MAATTENLSEIRIFVVHHAGFAVTGLDLEALGRIEPVIRES